MVIFVMVTVMTFVIVVIIMLIALMIIVPMPILGKVANALALVFITKLLPAAVLTLVFAVA